MDKKQSQIEGFDYPDLDLSDEDPPQDHDDVPSGNPTKKTKVDESTSKDNQVQADKSGGNGNKNDKQQAGFRPSAPFFPPPPLGQQSRGPSSGNPPWVPPPPMAQRVNNNQNRSYSNQQQQQNYQRPQYPKNQYNNNNNHHQNRDNNRQKKNMVYVKNIPKSYNTSDKLMTFFKNEGPIKQIKVNQVEQSAVIKFVKEEHSAKFLKSNKIIFNRSYIIYGENQFLSVTPQQVQDRLNDQLGNVKKAEKTNQKVLKEKVGNQLAENLRALYFLQNHLLEERSEDQQIRLFKEELRKEIEVKVEAKKRLEPEVTDEQFKPESYGTNFYDWTLTFVRKSATNIDRKHLFPQFLKYGPITALDYECISEKTPQNQDENRQGEEAAKPIFDYRIKILFLGVKNAWTVFNQKHSEIGMTAQGKQMQKFFESGKLKPVQLKKTRQTDTVTGSHSLSNQDNAENQAANKVEEVKVLEKQQGQKVAQEQPVAQ